VRASKKTDSGFTSFARPRHGRCGPEWILRTVHLWTGIAEESVDLFYDQGLGRIGCGSASIYGSRARKDILHNIFRQPIIIEFKPYVNGFVYNPLLLDIPNDANNIPFRSDAPIL
jgi:hypothetical protein